MHDDLPTLPRYTILVLGAKRSKSPSWGWPVRLCVRTWTFERSTWYNYERLESLREMRALKGWSMDEARPRSVGQ